MMRKAWNSKGRALGKQLVYFSSPNVMVRVSFKRGPNSIQYVSHREMAATERAGIERYLLDKLPVTIKLAKASTLSIRYMGVDEKLIAKLEQLPVNYKPTSNIEDESRAETAVRDLINQSLSNYYFEQIGNTLVEIRRLSALDKGFRQTELEEKLKKLVEAYNYHAENKVSVEEILPEESRECVK